MNFDPWKLLIGLMDFFSILLPGALMTYLLMGKVGMVVLGVRYLKLAGVQAWHACCSRAIECAPGLFCWAELRENRMN